MNPHHGRAAARLRAPVMPAVLAGHSWTARSIRNNCLRQHCHEITRLFRGPGFKQVGLGCARLFLALEERSRVPFELHPSELHLACAVARLAAYEASWLRQPEDWHPAEDDGAKTLWAGLLRHLLARWPVPDFMDTAWLLRGSREHFERDCWCAIGAGRSLRRVPGMPTSVSGRVLHLALQTQSAPDFASAMWQAQLTVLGAPQALAQAVLSSRVSKEPGNHARWLPLVEKFARGCADWSRHFALAADALMAIKAHRGSDQEQALLRLPLGDLVRHCIKFVAELLPANGHTMTEDQVRCAAEKKALSGMASSTWNPLLDSGPFLSRIGARHGHSSWQIVELTSVRDLQSEGSALCHCVAGYAQRCRQGSSAIFSLRHFREGEEPEAVATIEVAPRTRRIVQVRALRNRPVNNRSMSVIREWAAACRLE